MSIELATFPLPLRLQGHVLVQHLADGESVFLDLHAEKYFGIDSVGTEMWRALCEEESFDAVRRRLSEQFDVADPTLIRDLETFLQSLVERGLIVGFDGPTRSDPTPSAG